MSSEDLDVAVDLLLSLKSGSGDLPCWALLQQHGFHSVMRDALGLVLEFVGRWQHLYICGVSQAMKAAYHGHFCRQSPTSSRAVFGSPSRLVWAVGCGYKLNTAAVIAAGRFGSIATLVQA